MTDSTVALPFHRRYRPKRFRDLVGHRPVKEVLQGALSGGGASGCFLFHGPFGTGKTSLMRLMAASLLCTARDGAAIEPCGACPSCVEVFTGSEEALDYREHDAGNNTGADDARALAQWIAQHPVRGQRRIVAIDEIHKLSNAASSVLLKLVEEPPAHVLFLMATTDPEKVLPTIRSRAIALQLRPLTQDDIQARLAEVATAEGLSVGDDVLREIAAQAGGHLRDALQMLQQMALLNRAVELDDIWATSAKLPPRMAGRLCKAVLDGDAVGVLEQARALLADGLLAEQVVLGMEQLFRDCYLLCQVKGAESLVSLPKELLPKFKLLAGTQPPRVWRALLAATEPTVKRLGVHPGREPLLLDLWLLELLQVADPAVAVVNTAPVAVAHTTTAASAAEPTVKRKAAAVVAADPPELPTEPAPPARAPELSSDKAALIGSLRDRNLQRACKAATRFEVTEQQVVVSPSSARHRELLSEAAAEVAEAFSALLGRTVSLEVA